uniref:(California timema) hypothetical protein n=1 Tax=Timema californicum TaxID=61474 RepID=A0A7R9J3E6_TIMCA|nr:unnamed protein product [Timema californicum]
MHLLESLIEKGGVHPCIVCKTSLDQFLQSRPLPRSHALQYGLSEDQITPGARVCNTCRCKSVRSRYTQCPMPKCPNGKGRVKRLRSLPGKWAELPPEIRNPIIVEFQIPETLTKCCSACFNRISRRLAPHIQDGNAIAEDDQLSQCQQLRWSEEEIESAKRALKEFGTNWSKVAERVGNTKTHHQCKNFYFNYRKKMGLDLLVQEYNKNHLGEERKPTVTDEEESGSSTSSCDEMSGVPLNSDTDSAASPNNSQPIEEKRSSPMKTVLVSDVREEQLDLAKVRQATETEETKAPNPPTQTAVCKEDYDSSATETADEGQGGADADASAVVLVHRAGLKAHVTSLLEAEAQKWVEFCGAVSLNADERWRWQRGGVLSLQASDLGVVGLSIHASGDRKVASVSGSKWFRLPPWTGGRHKLPVPVQPGNGPVREGSPPTRSVKDLVLGMIEMQLLKNPGGHGNNTSVNLSGTIVEPTISSILKTDHHAEIHRSDITFGREYRSEAKSRQVQVTQDTSLATLSVVNSHHSSTPTSLHPHLPPPGSSLLERIPQCMQATITQCSTPSSVEFPKEGLVVVQVQQALRENEGVTLDLSIKKPRECSPSPLASIVRDSSPMGSRGDSPYQPIHQHHHHESPSLPPHTTLHTIPPPAHSKTVPSIHHPPSQPSVSVYRTSGVSGETGYYSHPVVLPPEQVHNVSKSQSVFPSETRGSSGPTPHLVMNQLQTQSRVATSTKMLKPAGHSVKVSPKLTHVAAKGGSITHGTPVSTAPLMVPSHLPPFMLQHPPRFEGLLRQMTPPQQTPAHGKDGTPLSGSITQGTPMHHVPHHLSSDKRVERTLIPIPGAVHDYYKRLSPAAPNVGNNHSNVVSGTYPPYPRDGSSTQTTSASGVFTSPYPHQASRPAGYATQQQLSSRQIIMNDYITSQQMDVSRRGSLGLGSNAPLDKTASQQDSPSPRIVSSSPHYYPPSSAASVYCRSSPANSNIMEQSQTPPHHTHTPPTRQGVIQRHNTNPCVQSRPPSSGNTKPPSPAASPHQRLHFLPHHPPTHHPHHHFPPLYPPPPGHEAFSSLVDVAVQQPSLPVPQKDSEKRQSTHHMHHHEGLGKSMADSLSNVRLLAEHQHQERERFSHLPPDQQRFVGFSKDWDVHSEQQRFHQDRFGPSLREGNPEIQQRMAASVREREREREREKDRERERENHLQQQQQRELQHHQQQMHLQKQIQQQQHQQLQLHRQQLQASHQHHNQPQQQQQQQQHQQQQHQQQQQTRITSGYESQKLAMYRENYRDTSDLGVRPQLLDRSFPREIPNAPPRHLPSSQQQLTHGDNRERELSNSGTPRGQGSSSRVAPGGDSSTLTAASLIDAIITHQINQSSTDSSVPGASSGGNSGSLPTRPGDRLFQGVHRDQPAPSSAHQSSGLHIPESNGKTSPLKSSHSPNVVHLDHEQQPTQQESSAPGNNTKVITLAEHIDSIITKDFNINPPTSAVSAHIAPHHRNMAQIYPHHPYHLLPPLPPTSTVAAEIMAEHQSWKLRKALQQQAKEMEVAREREKSSTAPGNALQSDERQIIRVAQPQSPRTKTSSGSYHMEPLSPSEHVASGHHWLPGGSVGSAGPSESMSFLPSRGRYSSEQTKDKPSHLSPLDYVKNRIVEVMRTSEEEKSEQAMTNQKQQPLAAAFVPPSTTYAYPFSALNVPSAARSPTPAQVSSVSTKIPVSGANNTNNIQISQQSKTLGSGQSQQSSVPASNSQSDVSSRPVEPAPLLSAQYEPLSDED